MIFGQVQLPVMLHRVGLLSGCSGRRRGKPSYGYCSFDGIMVTAVRRVVSPFTGGPFIACLTTIFLLDYIRLAFHST